VRQLCKRRKHGITPAAGAARAPRGGASGQLVQINGNTLILTGANGDVTVTYTTTTTITKTSTAALADITPASASSRPAPRTRPALITATCGAAGAQELERLHHRRAGVQSARRRQPAAYPERPGQHEPRER